MSLSSERVGNTKVQVSRIAYGCASIGNLYREVSDQQSMNVLNTAWNQGVRYFDTAPRYGRGLAEQRLGEFLSERPRDSYTLSTKVGRVLRPGSAPEEAEGFIKPLQNTVHEDYSKSGFAESLEGSIERLKTDYIDIVLIHDIGRYTHGDGNAAHMASLRDSGMEYLCELKALGKIGAIGLGVNENEICLEILKDYPIDIILLAGRLTLLDRSAEEALVPLCQNAGTSIVLGGIYNSGILATGPMPGAMYDYGPADTATLEEVVALEKRASALGMTLPEAAFQFAYNHPAVASVLVGTANEKTLNQNLHWAIQSAPENFNKVFG